MTLFLDMVWLDWMLLSSSLETLSCLKLVITAISLELFDRTFQETLVFPLDSPSFQATVDMQCAPTHETLYSTTYIEA